MSKAQPFDLDDLKAAVMDRLQRAFPLTESVALVFEPAPGLPAVVVPIAGSVPGVIGLPEVSYTSIEERW